MSVMLPALPGDPPPAATDRSCRPVPPWGLQREGAADALRLAFQVGVDRAQPLLPVAPVVAHLVAHGFQLFGIGDVAQLEQQLVGIVLDAAAAAEDALALLLQHLGETGGLFFSALAELFSSVGAPLVRSWKKEVTSRSGASVRSSALPPPLPVTTVR